MVPLTYKISVRSYISLYHLSLGFATCFILIMDLLNILQIFRSDEDLDLVDYKGKSLNTFSRSGELVEIADKINFKIMDLVKLGGIEPTTVNLCKVIHFGLVIHKEIQKQKNDTSEPPKKKKKSQADEKRVSSSILIKGFLYACICLISQVIR